MENRLTRFVYDHSPWFLRKVCASYYGWTKRRRRFRGTYDTWARLFEEARAWSESELRAFQNEKLAAQVCHAYQHAPYYRELFDRLKLRPHDVRTIEDLPKLPILDKETVRREGGRILSDQFDPRKLIWHPTSGSTGTPLQIPWQQSMEQMEWAFVWARFRPGVTRNDPCSTFTGVEIIPASRKRPPFWMDNWAAHQRMYSIFHMSEDNLHYYYQALNRRYSKYLAGYSSALAVVADYMLRHGLKLNRPPSHFFAASEELQPQNAEIIRQAFGCQIWNRYGQGELVGSITQYECGHMHYDMDFSIIEFLPVGEEDGMTMAEVIGTNMHELAWPLLRYRTGDVVAYDSHDRCSRGVPGQIVRRVHGRTGAFFTLPNGSRIINITVIARKCTNIRFMQVVQEVLGEIVIRVVRSLNFGPRDEERIRREFRRKLGDEIKIRIEYVDEIRRSKSGKYMAIVNRVGQSPQEA